MSERNQAERVIDAFGGIRKLQEALHAAGKPKDRITIYKWTCGKSNGGTGGYIPSSAWDAIFLAAETMKIVLSDDIVSPRRR